MFYHGLFAERAVYYGWAMERVVERGFLPWIDGRRGFELFFAEKWWAEWVVVRMVERTVERVVERMVLPRIVCSRVVLPRKGVGAGGRFGGSSRQLWHNGRYTKEG